MGTQNCVCLNPSETSRGEINCDKQQTEHEEKKSTNFEEHTLEKAKCGRYSESKKELISERLKSSKLPEEVNPTSDNDYGFDERLKPGLDVIEEEVSNKANDKVAEFEEKFGKFKLTEEEKAFVGNPALKKFTLLYPDNKICDYQYNGNWEREGYGCIYFPDGSTFKGVSKKDRMFRGRLITSEGDFYEGQYENDVANGFGKYISTEGVAYTGEWKNDSQHGTGEEIYPDGSNYNGDYFEGSKHGKGVFTWPDGTIYEGNFSNNKIEGYGTMKYLDGRQYEGTWMDNKMEGSGIFTWPDSKKYIGQYKHDKKWGVGVFYYNEGKVYEGFWYDGKQHGTGVLRTKNSIQICEWRMGKKIRVLPENESPDLEKFIAQIRSKVPKFEDTLQFEPAYSKNGHELNGNAHVLSEEQDGGLVVSTYA